MPKRLPPNNRPWPENMAFDFSLSPTITPTGAEEFIGGLATTERNRQFLLLRYKAGRTYNEIADEYGMTSTGVRLAVKTMWEKFSVAPAAPAPPAVSTPTVHDLTPQSAAKLPTAPAPPMMGESTTARPLSLNLASVRRFLG